jgi:hypothetical protein
MGRERGGGSREERGERLEVGDASDWWGPVVSEKKRKKRGREVGAERLARLALGRCPGLAQDALFLFFFLFYLSVFYFEF